MSGLPPTSHGHGIHVIEPVLEISKFEFWLGTECVCGDRMS